MPSPQIFSLGTKTLNPILFNVPETLQIVHRTLGGATDIPTSPGKHAIKATQTLGVVVDTIKFEATFIGPTADADTRKLQTMQLQQNVLKFQYGARVWNVVIMEFTETFRTKSEIGYAVELEPQMETSATSGKSSTSPSAALQQSCNDIVAQVAAADLQSQTDFIAQGQTNQDAAEISAQQAAAAVQDAATSASAYVSQVAATDLVTQTAQLTVLGASFAGAITGLTTIMGMLAASTSPSAIALYLTAASLRGLIASANATIGTATGANVATTVAVNGLNAYQLAVRYTGSAANVPAILAANNLTDPFNLGVASVVIPPGL